MISSLEREMVVSLSYATGRVEADMARHRCVDSIESAEKMLAIVEGMGNNPAKAVERLEKIATETEERAPLVPTPPLARHQGPPRAGGAAGAAAGGEDDFSDRGMPHSKSRHRVTGHERDLPRFSAASLEELVPFASVGLSVLTRNFHAYSAPSSSSSSSSSSPSSGAVAEADLKATLERVYQYWVHKRSGRSVSLLRCYHTFIMENWKVQDDLLPAHPEDKEPAALVSAHEKLVKLRRDLDRARLIIDRVRRRDKLKRELVRVAGESLEAFLASLPIAPDEADEDESPKKGAKGGAKAKGDKEADNKPARAAKESAKERLAYPSSGLSGAAGDEDSGDDGPLPFTLEDVNYDLLEPPKPTASLYGIGRDEDRQVSHHKGGTRRFVPQGPAGGAAASGWTADEDHLLLLGVAACGVGRWTEIREDFLLSRNSAQMNQRFTRLARRRCVLVKITGSSSGAPGKKSSSPKGNGGESEEEEPDQTNTEYTEVRTAFMTSAEVQRARSKLPPILIDMLEKYVEDQVWESIALRHLFDTQSKEKRCGRPQKYPLPIPIPKHLQNGGWVSRKKNLVQRPSALVPGWQPGAGGGYGLGVGSYQPSSGASGAAPSLSSAYDAQLPQPSPRPRGRPRKHPLKRESDEEAMDADEERILEAPADNSEWEARKAAQAAALARRKEEQDQSREERIKARGRLSALDALADAAAGSSDAEDPNSRGPSRAGKRAPRCSLGSLQAPGRKGRGRRGSGEEDEEEEEDEDEDEDEDEEEEEESGRVPRKQQAGSRRSAKRPRL
jgi:hypothetical protein